MKKSILIATFPLVLLACEQTPRSYTAAEAHKICQEKMRDAEGPRTNVTMGTNSRSGPFGGVSISVSDSYLSGKDPKQVYADCMASLPIVN